MPPVTLEVDTSALKPLLASLRDSPRVVIAVMRTVMRRAMVLAERAAKESVTANLLRVRTGRLRASIASRVESDAATIYGRLGLLTPKDGQVLLYGAAHEFGTAGPIVAKNAFRTLPGGPYLTIPLPAALTAAGVPRFTVRGITSAGYAGWFTALSRAGNWLVFGVRQKGRRPKAQPGRDPNTVPLFVLKHEVPALPALHYLGRAAADVLPYIAESCGVLLEAKLLTAATASLA